MKFAVRIQALDDDGDFDDSFDVVVYEDEADDDEMGQLIDQLGEWMATR